jgi:hypothetical protein
LELVGKKKKLLMWGQMTAAKRVLKRELEQELERSVVVMVVVLEVE